MEKGINSKFKVFGTVTNTQAKRLSSLLVRAYDRDLRNEEQLGEQLTNELGHYEITYKREQFARAEKHSADLWLKLYSADGKTLVYEMPIDKILFNAPAEAKLDITIDVPVERSGNEFDSIIKEISPLLEKLPINKLEQNTKVRDLTFLSKETGIEEIKLDHLVVAYRLADKSKIDPAFFYALLRKNTLLKLDLAKAIHARLQIDINTDTESLLYEVALVDEKRIEKDVIAAIEEELIPQRIAKELKTILARLRKLRDQAGEYVEAERRKKILNLIGTFVRTDKVAELEKLFQQSKYDYGKFLDTISSTDFFNSKLDEQQAKLQTSLTEILGFNDQIIIKAKELEGLEKPEDVKKLAAMNPARWREVLTKSADKIGSKGKPLDKDLIHFHASSLARKMEAKYPAVAFTAQLKREQKPKLREHEQIVKLVNEHEDFDIAHTNVDSFFKKKKINTAKNEGAKNELKSVQRIFKLVPHYNKANALLEKKINSAHSIVATGESRFVREIAPKAGIRAKEARSIFHRAENTQIAAMMMVGDFQDTIRSMDIKALQSPVAMKKLEAVSKEFPNLKSLFQVADTCACEHCRSVYSPAAYLVEVLQFLDKRSVVDLITPITPRPAKDVLFERRPGLGDIDLGCENANTPLPYIDLVCEVLEEVVKPDPGISFIGAIAKGPIPNALLLELNAKNIPVTNKAAIFDPDINGHFILRDEKAVCKIINNGGNNWSVKLLHQTHGTAEELAAAPEYVNLEAYQELSTSKYAFRLPFDLNHYEATSYFSRFGISRSQLMTDFQKGGVPSDEEIAAEKLGLTDEERKLITKPEPSDQHVYWNTTSLTATDEMKVVDLFLQKSGLTYKELQDFLTLRFINPNDLFYIKHHDNSCDTAKKEIINLDDNGLGRMHRFLRLMKKTGWKPEVIDEMIMQSRLGNGILNNDCLIKMADLLTLKEESGLKLEELIGFYGELPHREIPDYPRKPLYHTIFLNKAVNGIIDEDLLPEKIDGTNLLDNFKTVLALCLQISEKDFDKVVAALSNNFLTFQNLSSLYAIARLSKKLKLKIDDFLIFKDLTGLDISSGPSATLEFVRRVAKSKISPLKISDVKFVLRHEAENLADREMSESKITKLIESLQRSYQTAFGTNISPFDDALTSEELKEPLKTMLSKMPGFKEKDVNGFLKMVDRDWNSPPDPAAATFIDDRLSTLFDTTDIKNRQNVLATAAGPDFENERKLLIKAFLAPLTKYFYQQEKRTILIKAISTAFKADEDIATATIDLTKLKQPPPGTSLIADLLSTDSLIDPTNSDPPLFPPITTTTFLDQRRAIKLLHKLFPLISAFKLDVETLKWFLQNSSSIGLFELPQIPYEAAQVAVAYTEWEAFLQIFSYSQKLSAVQNPADAEVPLTFFKVMEKLFLGATTRSEWLDALALLTSYDRDKLDQLDLHFGYSNPDLSAYRKPATWDQIDKCMSHIRMIDVTVDQIKKFIKAKLDSDDVRQLRMALKARYDEKLWLNTLKEITDSIRPQKRDALVAYLLATNPEMKDENYLFDYFLVDVQMEACMPSSRIVQAHGTTQLFAQRCLMGLEPECAADTTDKGWDQWKWMKNYRVWEANRKVFLYPENWIEPELLDDKSYLFSELEDELLQNEVNESTTEDALIRYLEKLDEIAFLEVVATYYQTDVFTMHVFARTKGGDPPIYYYRRFEGERYWTPWEKVELDITSDHLLAFMRNNRLYLAWPIFSEVPNPNQTADVPGVSGSPTLGQPMQKVQRKLKIQLAISEYANKQWKSKKVSKDGIETPPGENQYTTDEIPRDKFKFFYNQFAEQIIVFTTRVRTTQQINGSPQSVQETLDFGAFDLTGCKGYPELAPSKPFNPNFLPQFKDSDFLLQRYKELNLDKTNDLAVNNVFSFFTFRELLLQTPGTFRITYPHQFTIIDLLALLFEMWIYQVLSSRLENIRGFQWRIPMGTLLPYFFEDGVHNYVIVPGFYRDEFQINGGKPISIRRTASNVMKLIQDGIAIYVKYLMRFQADPNQDMQLFWQDFFNDQTVKDFFNDLSVYPNLTYGEKFQNFYHPLLCMLRSILYKDGIPALMKRETQLFVNPFFDFATNYNPVNPPVPPPYPKEELDFSSDGSYSCYNWELFFHAPLMIATRLSKNQKFEEASTWFHYMFNPMGTLPGPIPQKYWVTKPFFQTLDADYIAQRIDTLLTKIADPSTPERIELEFAIDQWRQKPFKPHVIARFRPLAYQKTLLMKYIDHFYEWGDYLFRQDTMESVTQATQMYILADKLLGPKPRIIPPAVKMPYETYNQLEAKLDAFGNALIEFENMVPDISLLPHGGAELPPSPITLSSLYFCIPQNDKMLDYWDRIADRLFKIRHCQNIDGVERTLALFAPPIDPGMLVRATAAGLDISSILAGLNAPVPYYRFSVLSQKATELVQEVRGLGNSLLQALEKKDAEAMALLRSQLEIKVLQAVRDMKKLQIGEATEQIEVLKRTKAVTEERNKYYAAIQKIIPNEQLNLDKLAEAHEYQNAAQIAQAVGGILALIPDFNLGGHGVGGSPVVHASFGGTNLSRAASAAAGVLNVFSGMASYEASRASILGGYDRRFDDWKLQERLSDKELVQIDQQIAAAQIRLEISKTDLKNHDLQIENAQKTDEFMRTKYTNKDLYVWMIGQISSVYFRAYQLARDMAKKAERCYQHELGSTDTFVDSPYWDSLKKGLQAADLLFHDIKRMETSYLDKNKREYELTKHVSLAMLDPLALVRLRATGICDFEIPEALFDMDHPGHYFRRIKSLSVTFPCITGPYTTVGAKLSLVSNKYRKNTSKAQGAASPKEEYEEVPGNDDRFTYNVGTIQSVATSASQNDSGLFEMNFRDERYLPFEGCGAIGTWRLEFPKEIQQFDYNTISDVIIHMKYTAREGGTTLRTLAENTLKEKLSEIKESLGEIGMHIAFNLRYDMPNEWYQLKTSGKVSLKIAKTRLPYFVQNLLPEPDIDTSMFIASVKGDPATFPIGIDGNPLPLNRISTELKLCWGKNPTVELDTPFELSVPGQLSNLDNLMMVVKYTFA